ncbi:protein CrcB [Methylocapsa palsarum]|uniref:Fluoride-specific ion channel FluC n=1 Tax=Methylocapsa palsarum TaxID=1612308 RepID=A0A1I3WTX2_9HYPH|nr:fluoride efflux transporter CrcB [Methylocapsa palsarum]SFK10609.1 protein CrcB [Methylocapsa palsarum]
MLYVWIMVGSALGGGARFWVSNFVNTHFGETFPWGTILVNISGSLVIGFFATLTGPDGVLLVSTTARQFVMIGLCGGYTTFSSFSIQTLNLVRDGDWLRAGANVAVSLAFCFFAVWLGHVAAATLNQLEGGFEPRFRFPPERAPQTAPRRETEPGSGAGHVMQAPPADATEEGASAPRPHAPDAGVNPPQTGASRDEKAPASEYAPRGAEVPLPPPLPPPRPRNLKPGEPATKSRTPPSPRK